MGLSVDLMGGTSTCCMPFLACRSALILAAAAAERQQRQYMHLQRHVRNSRVSLPAAAAGFTALLGLLESLVRGLRLLVSFWRAEGERDLERRSKREGLRGSVWSKREGILGTSGRIQVTYATRISDQGVSVHRQLRGLCVCGSDSRLEVGAFPSLGSCLGQRSTNVMEEPII